MGMVAGNKHSPLVFYKLLLFRYYGTSAQVRFYIKFFERDIVDAWIFYHSRIFNRNNKTLACLVFKCVLFISFLLVVVQWNGDLTVFLLKGSFFIYFDFCFLTNSIIFAFTNDIIIK